MQQMHVYGVSFDLVGKQPIVLLKTVDGNRFLPIWIGHPEAAAILMKLQNAATPRPMTHDLGVRIAIDDFGTGFSSLGQLRRFPIDVIKVDRSFVQNVEGDAKSAAITSNLARLASSLGLTSIAEGIESDSQLASVRELGVDVAQGYLFARALPPDELTAMLLGDAPAFAKRSA